MFKSNEKGAMGVTILIIVIIIIAGAIYFWGGSDDQATVEGENADVMVEDEGAAAVGEAMEDDAAMEEGDAMEESAE